MALFLLVCKEYDETENDFSVSFSPRLRTSSANGTGNLMVNNMAFIVFL